MKDKGGGIFYRKLTSGIVISSLVFLVAGTISIFGSIGAMLAPLPILYYYSKLGRVQGVFIFAVSLVVATVAMRLMGSHTAFPSLLLLGSVGPILSEILRRSYSIEKTVLYSVAALLVIGVIFLFYLSLTLSKTPLYVIESYVAGVVEENIRVYSQLGSSSEQVAMIRDHAGNITRFLTNLFPAIILVGTSFFAWLNILAGKVLFERSGMWYPDFGDLSRWTVRDKYIWIVIASGVLLMVPLGWIKIVALNVLIISLFLYLFQGLSIINFYFNKKNIPMFVRMIGYVLIFAQQFLLLLVIGLGLIDVWADFRKLKKE